MDEPILVLSDIEGQYTAFENLLLAGKVMDNHQHCTFGKGHLVLLGDMMDRGDQVMEILQLIRKLKTEALNAGGRSGVYGANQINVN